MARISEWCIYIDIQEHAQKHTQRTHMNTDTHTSVDSKRLRNIPEYIFALLLSEDKM